jgi:type II secretory pathway predicted ATPase ExeA
MYKRFFGLHSSPFNVNPDPRFLFLTRSAQEALASLTYGIQMQKGFVLLTGEVGTGKTTLINRVLDWLRQRKVATSFVFNSTVNVPQFFDLMMADFGLDCGSMEKSRMLLKLNSWLLERHRTGGTAVLIVDEAQNLSTEVLEEIRLLTNLETSTQKLLQIVLSGQPELDEKLKLPQLRQLNQRITLRCHTQTLTEAETGSYIESRLRIAGATGRIFLPEASQSVFRHTRGIPRLVNVLCEHSLISAYVDQYKQVLAGTVDRVAKELEIDSTASVSARIPHVQVPVMNGAPEHVMAGNGTRAIHSPRNGTEVQMSQVMSQLSVLDERVRELSARTAVKEE